MAQGQFSSDVVNGVLVRKDDRPTTIALYQQRSTQFLVRARLRVLLPEVSGMEPGARAGVCTELLWIKRNNCIRMTTAMYIVSNYQALLSNFRFYSSVVVSILV